MKTLKFSQKEKYAFLILVGVILAISSYITYNNTGEFNMFHITGLTLSLAFNAFLFALVIKLTEDK